MLTDIGVIMLTFSTVSLAWTRGLQASRLQLSVVSVPPVKSVFIRVHSSRRGQTKADPWLKTFVLASHGRCPVFAPSRLLPFALMPLLILRTPGENLTQSRKVAETQS